jgi:hypothetical protein
VERTPLSERKLRWGEVIWRVISGEFTSVDASELLDRATTYLQREKRSDSKASLPTPGRTSLEAH